MTEEDRLLLKELKTNVQQLFSSFKHLENENQLLHDEISKLRNKIGELEHEKSEVGRKNEQLKIANQLLSEKQGNGEAKQKINLLIREIDKCIALLNK
ncbi:hypothetical protein INQ51_21490 [Maribellus sp. CM-23]|uniref:hypothetical protein n=1 Tax=Maribellus sp. CM-23 TaxID=2781026 RepID=UPI001F36AD17|nr:hypothetical protein [Maribellus sp. CM-23]MCE4566910.1 hypothetical protein [Maribellus sp. CM-23]